MLWGLIIAAPLIIPNSEERECYVPDIVCSCVSIIQNNDLVVPNPMRPDSHGGHNFSQRPDLQTI